MMEYRDGQWLVLELIPDLIVADSGIQGGEPTIKGTRMTTVTLAFAYENHEVQCYGDYSEQQAFAAYCFEAGREYQRNRKLRKRLLESTMQEARQAFAKLEKDMNAPWWADKKEQVIPAGVGE